MSKFFEEKKEDKKYSVKKEKEKTERDNEPEFQNSEQMVARMRLVKMLRVEKGISKISMAKKVGMSVTHYGLIETSKHRTTMESMDAICEVLGCRLVVVPIK